jgi:hypothetical protein
MKDLQILVVDDQSSKIYTLIRSSTIEQSPEAFLGDHRITQKSP